GFFVVKRSTCASSPPSAYGRPTGYVGPGVHVVGSADGFSSRCTSDLIGHGESESAGIESNAATSIVPARAGSSVPLPGITTTISNVNVVPPSALGVPPVGTTTMRPGACGNPHEGHDGSDVCSAACVGSASTSESPRR